MTRLLAAASAVAAGGRFISVWTVLVALPLSLTVMAPQSAATPASAKLLAGLATWVCFAAALAAIGVSERRVAAPRRRRAVVIVGVLLAATLRPFVQDAWLAAVTGSSAPLDHLPFRVATNVVVWAVVFTTVALIVDALRSARETNALLRTVLAEADAAHLRTDAVTAAARAALDDAGAALDGDLRGLTADAAAVRHLSERFRSWSHTLAELATAPAPPAPGVHSPTDTRRRARRMPLRLPPVGIVSAIYIACLLPYAARASSPAEILVSAAIAIAGGACADRGARLRAVASRGSLAAFVGISILVGAALSVEAALSGAAPVAALVPALVYPVLALGAAAVAGARQTLRVEQRRLSSAIAAEQRAMRAGTAPARAALEQAAELLHREGQGQCTVFLLQHPSPSPVDVKELAAHLGALLTRVRGVFDGAPAEAASLAELATIWGRVIGLSLHVSPEAQTALSAEPPVARDAYDIVAEGILNAVKHTSEHRAEVSVDVIATGAGPHLRVRVRSFGALPRGVELRPASHVRARGAQVHRTPEGAVLEAVFALSPRASAPAVVSAEHRAGAPKPRS